MRHGIGVKILFSVLGFVILLMIFWDWDWFIPIVDAQATAALGRKVTMQHLHVALGRRVTATAYGLVIANPDGFPAADPQLATAGRLAVTVDVVDYIFHHQLSVPGIELDQPVINARELDRKSVV